MRTMKRISIYILSVLAVFSYTACTDLEVENKAALPEEIVLGDISGFQSILNASYESVNDFNHYGQQMIIGPEVLADNMDLVQQTGRYELEFVNAENSGIGIWQARYNGINEANIVINGVEDPAVEGDPGEKTSLRAQALFLRALFYHDLARAYGYEPGQEVNGFNLAVPLKTTATKGLSDVEDLPRATNLQVYQQIESDLLEAIPNLPVVDAGSADVKFANQDAARLLLARVYLYWGRSADAATTAQQVIAGDGSDLVAAADYFDSWDDQQFPFHPESLFESEILLLDWNSVDGANASLHSLLMNDTGGSQFILTASQELIDEINSEPGDVRGDLFNTEPLGQEFNKWRGAGPQPFMENIPVLRLSEGYLIAAEALGPGAGDPFLNAVRTSRGLAGGVQATVDNVLRERRIEFMAEGHRWFDLKRLGRDITKPASANTSTLPYTDFKILPRIPERELNLSEALQQNPGYN